MRLFVAVGLPEIVRVHAFEVVHAMQRALRSAGESPRGPNVKWTRENNLHITIHFLGEVADADVAPLCESLKGVSRAGEMRLRIDGAEMFPPAGPIRIVAIGVKGDTDRLSRVHDDIESRCEAFGIPAEAREYRPHVTIGRARPPLPSRVRSMLARGVSAAGPEFSVTEFVLIESRLNDRGPDHAVAARFPLI